MQFVFLRIHSQSGLWRRGHPQRQAVGPPRNSQGEHPSLQRLALCLPSLGKQWLPWTTGSALHLPILTVGPPSQLLLPCRMPLAVPEPPALQLRVRGAALGPTLEVSLDSIVECS